MTIPDETAPTLLILGATARAAAWSALRAGFRPRALDLFADRDLLAIAEARRVPFTDGPDLLAQAAGEEPPGPWMYTGALENDPDLIDRIARSRPLLGNPGEVLRRVRDPFLLATLFREAGLPFAPVRRHAAACDDRVRWLFKPFRSGGGLGIRFHHASDDIRPEHGYFQRWIRGRPGSATYLAASSTARLIGATRQLLERGSFHYGGSLGPWPLPRSSIRTLQEIGELLVRRSGLRGLFGVDFVLRGNRPWVVEVNPRYTASVEVLELAGHRALLREHVAAFDSSIRARRPADRGYRRVVGKRVLWADRQVRIPSLPLETGPGGSFDVPRWADLPDPAAPIERGQPICSILAEGRTHREVRRRLRRRADRCRAMVRESPGILVPDSRRSLQ